MKTSICQCVSMLQLLCLTSPNFGSPHLVSFESDLICHMVKLHRMPHYQSSYQCDVSPQATGSHEQHRFEEPT